MREPLSPRRRARPWWASGVAMAFLAPAAASDDPEIRFSRDVRPILSDRCFLCHGPDRETRESGLRLDVFEDATAAREGGAAIVPGNPAESVLWQRITASDPAERMPPADSHKAALDADELDTIRRWIEGGARYDAHWAFVPPQRSAPPDEPGDGASWARNDIDRFVLRTLRDAGLDPSPEADPERLLRRVFLDLSGLPPTPEEIAEYLADDRPDRYEQMVDRLLHEEPYRSRYAEHMTASWLDLARYADTSGIHMDNGRSIWPWRDWVLRAYRDHMPFDRFTIEQLAGDLLPGATLDQVVASGFNRNHVTTDEGGVIAEEYLVEYAADRVSTTGSVFLGLTLGCARCHDHKFDPVTMEDFYSLIAFFNSIDEPGLYSQTEDSKRAYEPFIAVPSAEQLAELAALRDERAGVIAERDTEAPEEVAQRAAFLDGLPARAGLRWLVPGDGLELLGASSTAGSVLTPQPDGSILASGPNPDRDHHVIRLRTDAIGLRLLALEALPDPSLPSGRVGRAPNGNAVLSSVSVEAVSIADPTQRQPIALAWAWADIEQANGDFRVVNTLDPSPDRGWAVDAHGDPADAPAPRAALFLAAAPFGFDGGTELVCTLRYDSVYAQHTLGRVRLSVSAVSDDGLGRLPIAAGSFHRAGPFAGARDAVFDEAFGPELATFDPAARFGEQAWRFAPEVRDGAVVPLADGVHAEYVARELFAPSARELELSLGSDDGLRLFVNGEEVFSRRVDRGVAPDQDRATVRLNPGRNSLVYKVVNTGGVSGISTRGIERPDTLAPAMTAALLPTGAHTERRLAAAREAWRLRFSPRYAQLSERARELDARLTELDAAVPRSMVMKELPQPRETFVLTRGQYDQPDPDRPVTRRVPESLGELPPDAPRNRLGLARWLVSEDNPLTARVTVNRLWASFFGEGLVRTPDDFGLQGAWPSSPELLDALAIELRDSGWDVQHIQRLIVTSSTYRQASRRAPDAAAIDPANRLLGWFPRQRLSAEQVRDQALFASGLLVEHMGGPSVKPYQPEGLWREVAMPQSNTRVFERGAGSDLYRRSLYTYWKRAAPPPSMLTFDAPTREFCSVRRLPTNTPLQALVLWNDEQFVEAARHVAARVLRAGGSNSQRLDLASRLLTSAAPDDPRRAALLAALADFRARYADAPADARALLAVGASEPASESDPAELAAWTMIASALLSSDAALTKP